MADEMHAAPSVPRGAARSLVLSFALMNGDEILRYSALEGDGVTSEHMFRDDEPLPNSLFDLRMGPSRRQDRCETCNGTNKTCLGHQGHIVLATQLPPTILLLRRRLALLLTLICLGCGAPRRPAHNEGASADADAISRSGRKLSPLERAMALKRCKCGAMFARKVKIEDVRVKVTYNAFAPSSALAKARARKKAAAAKKKAEARRQRAKKGRGGNDGGDGGDDGDDDDDAEDIYGQRRVRFAELDKDDVDGGDDDEASGARSVFRNTRVREHAEARDTRRGGDDDDELGLVDEALQHVASRRARRDVAAERRVSGAANQRNESNEMAELDELEEAAAHYEEVLEARRLDAIESAITRASRASGTGALDDDAFGRRGDGDDGADGGDEALEAGAAPTLSSAELLRLYPHGGAPETLLSGEVLERTMRRYDIAWAQRMTGTENPSALVLTVFPVPPPCVRPSLIAGDSGGDTSRSSDALTSHLNHIVKLNNALRRLGDNYAPSALVHEASAALFNAISEYLDTSTRPAMAVQRRVGAMTHAMSAIDKGIKQRLDGKEGLFRENMMGKRVDFCARSVISGDPTLELDQLGVPHSIANKLTYPERLFALNEVALRNCVRRGANVEGGAAYIVLPDDGSGGEPRRMSLADMDALELERVACSLTSEYIVERHLRDGDLVIFNRQPSLHKMSVMAHRVKRLPWSTFRMNLSVTSPYNADFDGDEMNMHVPQSLACVAELHVLVAVQQQMVTPASNKPCMGIVQDSLTALYILTQRDTFLTRDDAMHVLSALAFDRDEPENERGGLGGTGSFELPVPAILCARQRDALGRVTADSGPLWTGKQLFSLALPFYGERHGALTLLAENETLDATAIARRFGHPLRSYTRQNGLGDDAVLEAEAAKRRASVDSSDSRVHIVHGELVSGALTKAVLGAVSGSIIHVLWAFEPRLAARFARDAQRLAQAYFDLRSFTAGIADVVPSAHIRANVDRIVDEDLAKVDVLLERYLSEKIPRTYFESSITAQLNGLCARVGDFVRKNVAHTNAFRVTADSGSKGTSINIAQIMACLGQQSVDGGRVEQQFRGRTLPHYTQLDFGARAGGNVLSSFYTGLAPDEFFWHAKGGRVGVIDTAIKTAETGYLQRRIVKLLEDVRVLYDGTVRDAENRIFQFLYGEDGLDATYVAGESLLMLRLRGAKLEAPERYVVLHEASRADLDAVLASHYRVDFSKIGNALDVLRASEGLREDDFSHDFGPLITVLMNEYEECVEAARLLSHSLLDAKHALLPVPLSTAIGEARERAAQRRERELLRDAQRAGESQRRRRRRRAAKEESGSDDAANAPSALSPSDVRPLSTAHVRARRATLEGMLARVWSSVDKARSLFGAAILSELATRRVLFEYRLDRASFDEMMNYLEEKAQLARAAAGEMVGIIAGQSTGEPTTQMTLNSVVWDTEMVFSTSTGAVRMPIGQFIDEHMEREAMRIVRVPENRTELLELAAGSSLAVPSVGAACDISWQRVTALTRHAPLGRLIKIRTSSGRTVTATRQKSFLTWDNDDQLLVITDGADLRVGMRVPVALSLVDAPSDIVPATSHLDLSRYLPKTEYIYGTDLLNAHAMWSKPREPVKGGWYEHHNGRSFTLPYKRGDTAMAAVTRTQSVVFRRGIIYPGKPNRTVSLIPDRVPFDAEFGFFVGIYIADGLVTDTFMNISKRCPVVRKRVTDLMDKWHITYRVVESTNAMMPGVVSTSLVIHSTTLARWFNAWLGTGAANKYVPAEAWTAPLEFARGLLDGYFSGDGTVNKRDLYLVMGSSSKKLIDGIAFLCARFGIFGRISSYQPSSNNLGTETIARVHTFSVRNKWARLWAEKISSTMPEKKALLDTIVYSGAENVYEEFGDVVLDEIVALEEIDEAAHPHVYDLTVENTCTFLVGNGLGMYDTFHKAGAFSIGMTQGIPRILEMLNLPPRVKKPLVAVEIRDSVSAEARAKALAKVAVHTTLRSLARRTEIFYDPDMAASRINDDRVWLDLLAATYDEGDSSVALRDLPPWVLRISLVARSLFDVESNAERFRGTYIVKRLRSTAAAFFKKCAHINTGRAMAQLSVFYSNNEPHPLDDLVLHVRVGSRAADAVSIFVNEKGAPLLFEEGDDGHALEERLVREMLIDLSEAFLDTTLGGIEGVTQAVARKEMLESGATRHMLDIAGDVPLERIQAWCLAHEGDGDDDVRHDESGPLVNTLVPNDVREIERVYGIEAARAYAVRELGVVMARDASYVNTRHFMLLVDVMSHTGTMLPVTRHGLKKLGRAPLARASFEEQTTHMVEAALRGETDALQAVSSQIVAGRLPNVGTNGHFSLMLDAEFVESAVIYHENTFVEALPPPDIEDSAEAWQRAAPIWQPLDEVMDGIVACPASPSSYDIYSDASDRMITLEGAAPPRTPIALFENAYANPDAESMLLCYGDVGAPMEMSSTALSQLFAPLYDCPASPSALRHGAATAAAAEAPMAMREIAAGYEIGGPPVIANDGVGGGGGARNAAPLRLGHGRVSPSLVATRTAATAVADAQSTQRLKQRSSRLWDSVHAGAEIGSDSRSVQFGNLSDHFVRARDEPTLFASRCATEAWQHHGGGGGGNSMEQEVDALIADAISMHHQHQHHHSNGGSDANVYVPGGPVAAAATTVAGYCPEQPMDDDLFRRLISARKRTREQNDGNL